MKKILLIMVMVVAVSTLVVGYVNYATPKETVPNKENLIEIEDKTPDKEDLEDIKSIATEEEQELAVLVSNQDFPDEELNRIAIEKGYGSLHMMIGHLVHVGELVYIPAFTYEGEDGTYEYEATYSTKRTVVYNDAVEMGVIE